VNYNAAQQHRLNTMLTQRTLNVISDNPRQFVEPPFFGLVQQCWRERSGRDSGLDAMTVLF